MKTACRIKKNDKVKIIAGKEKGKIGKVLKIIRKSRRLIVENANMVKRHTRAGGPSRQGGIIEKESPLDFSNVMLICDKCMQNIRIKMKELEDGKKVRVCRKCGEILDK
ncbi:MAG: 50S ribosomal protein L24 [Desulfobacterales bacterium C00003106]|jgi:large subunit ribosomal protein L24|nr:50S ribosomal protein L24 [Pseudomonadota bacterium]MDL1978859.1 50S ribosomal protein L24 [Deltaproteobacteria bacterium]OEU56545.1 MAG: 50S ribosomal protein L24 [Desulfobacterales bacterium C00003106]OEU59980.1 MAG: 50S ribosomal protein L24 [Desulfobacterales bacterium C00003104]